MRVCPAPGRLSGEFRKARLRVRAPGGAAQEKVEAAQLEVEKLKAENAKLEARLEKLEKAAH